MKSYAALLGCVLLASCSVPHAPLAAFSWHDDVCQYHGRYNPHAISEEVLNDTAVLLYHYHSYQYIDDDVLSVLAVRQAYEPQLARLRSMKLPQALPIQRYWRENLAQTQFFYDLSKVEAQAKARNNIALLQQFTPAQLPCQHHVQALGAVAIQHRFSSQPFADWHNCAIQLQPTVLANDSALERERLNQAFAGLMQDVQAHDCEMH